RLVVDTIGVPNLCEHVPSHLIWAVIADIGAHALGAAATRAQTIPALPAQAPTRPTPPQPLVSPPPEAVPQPMAASHTPRTPIGTPARPIPTPAKEPLSDLIDELEADAP